MNKLNMRKKSIYDYKTVVFDLDGTLYFQKPFRIRMLTYLIGYMITHPSSVKDIFIIKKYREVRESWEERDQGDKNMSLDDRQYAYVADKMKVKPDHVKKAVTFYMLEAPLKLLKPYRDEVLSDIIQKLHKQGTVVVVYSDYPVEDKLKALDIKADLCYTSADEKIGSMKPDPKGLSVILKDLDLSSKDVLMIGDRYEKDGLAAEKNDVDYIIVGKTKKDRKNLSH